MFCIGAVVLLLISSTVSMAVPFGIGKVIDTIFTQNDGIDITERLKGIYKILFGIFIVGGLANFGRVYLMRISGKLYVYSTILIRQGMSFIW